MIRHVIERFVIHFFSAYGLVCGTWFVLSMVRKKARQWLPSGWLALYVISGLFIAFVGFVREPFDVKFAGDPWWKSYSDMTSWIGGSAVAVWGQYRTYYRILKWGE